jgi:tetratricopeptide (TPR) repeat protein
MVDNPRLDSLRRRVQQDPSSIAFAQLAEEYRRAGMLQEAVDVCRAGLGTHPAYVSARVTLGRALMELRQYEPAQQELEQVLRSAPENLAAIRGLADVLHRQGLFEESLLQYRAALTLVRHDPDLEQTIAELERKVESAPAVAVALAPSPEEAPVLEFTHHAAVDDAPAVVVDSAAEQASLRALATVAALERMLTAVHVARAERCA